VIVLDALDEAPVHQQIAMKLLIPLARARRPDGTPACRLLIGMRPWREFTPLLDLAQNLGEVLDLDAIPAEQRRQDVADYIAALLELLPGYSTTAHSRGRHAFADAVAAALVADQTGSPAAHMPVTTEAEVRWGEFLVAALYTHTISLHSPNRISDSGDAARLGAAVPRTLPGVLEFDLASRPASPWRRAVLRALAHARGAGMPRSVLPAVCAAIAGSAVAPSVEQVGEQLDALRFYLRTGVDSEGSALYRLFHQGLADYLRDGGDGGPADMSGQVLDGLLATVAVAGGVRWWDLAEPHLLRHAVQHAAEASRVDELLINPEFLVHADPTALIPALDQADGESARLAAAVYRVSAGGHPRRAVDQRRDVLAVDAARYSAAALLKGLTSTRGATRSRWRPRWATGGEVSTALRATLTGHTDPVTAVACTQLDGHPIAVTTGRDSTVRIWDLTTGIRIGDPLTGHTDPVTAVACTQLEGRPIAVTTGGWDGTVRIWDLTSGTSIGDPLTGHTSTVTAVACTQLEDRPIAVTTGGWDGTVRIWDLTSGTSIGDPLTGHTHPVTAVACTQLEDRPIAVTTGGWDGTVRIWDLTSGTQIGNPLTGHTSTVTAVACTQLEDRPIAVTTGRDHMVRIWDLTSGTPIGDPLTGHTHPVTAVACTQLEDGPIAVTTGGWDGTVRIWDLTSGTPIGDPLTGHTHTVEAVACTQLEGRSIAVTTGRDHMVRIWDLTLGTPIGDPLTGHTHPVTAVACTQLDGHPIAVTTGVDRTVRIWDLTFGTPIGDPLTGHTHPVTAVACTQLDGHPIAVTGGEDGTVRVWDLAARRQIDEINLPTGVGCIDVTGVGDIVVVFGRDIVLLEQRSGGRRP
jgi:WD40 repeat protein